MSQATSDAVDGAVVDVGAGENPDPRADFTADLYASADFEFDIREPWPFEDAAVGGLIARHVVEHVEHATLREHVFPEAARVLEPGGWLEVRTPLGSDARTDPTHRSLWEWRTPEHYADNGRHWQADTGLALDDRRLHVWMIRPLEPLTPLVRFGAKRWPMEAWYELPGATGELIATYRRTDDGA